MCRSLRILSLLALMMTLAATAAMAAKVEICHFPPGNQDNWHTISVSTNALNAHLNHGDLEGSCFANCETICDDGDACTQDVEPDDAVCICLAEPTPVNCDDDNPCTADSCSSAAGACVYDTAVLDGTACDDGDPDTGVDLCVDGACVPVACPCWTQEELDGLPFPAAGDVASCVDGGSQSVWEFGDSFADPIEYKYEVYAISSYCYINVTEDFQQVLFQGSSLMANEFAACQSQIRAIGAERGFDCF